MENVLYYGDNLDVLRRYVADESVDLVYIDPPFNSNASYNVLFAEQDGSRSAAQIKAFGDTWRWDQAASRAFQETVEQGGAVSQALQAFRQLIGENDMLAYLAMMAPRLVELHRVLKSSGSMYLHCDSIAVHYLKLLMDAVFGPENYRNQIVWKRTSAHNDPKRFGRVHDILLYYAMDVRHVFFAPVYVDYDPEYLKAEFRQDEHGRWYKIENLTAPSHGRNSGRFEFHGRTPGPSRMWRFSSDEMERLWVAGRIRKDSNGIPLLRGELIYLDERKGMPVQDWWGDIDRVGNTAKERLGYPTQKPEALLERIISASSSPGDVVLDAFCGCGTAVVAAQKLGRSWIGIDITHLSINLIRHRLTDAYGAETKYRVIGEPTTVQDAQELADQDKYQFQWWALGLVGARPAVADQKKGSDRGIDGRLFFHDEGPSGKTKQVIFSVKGGHTNVGDVRDLGHVVDRETAQIGVLISLQESTQPMRSEAASAGFYESAWGTHPRLQVLTIAELLAGKRIDMPPVGQVNVTFKRAPKAREAALNQRSLLADFDQ